MRAFVVFTVLLSLVGPWTVIPVAQSTTTPPDGVSGVPAPGRAGAPPGAGASPAPPLTQAAIDKAAPILAAARQALGGDKLAAIRTLSARGQTRRVRGNNLVPILFEMDLELPDKYLRKDESPAENSDPTSLGFNGNALLQVPPPAALPAAPPTRAGAPPVPEAALDAARVARIRNSSVDRVKQDFVRFALGMFAQSFDTYPLTFGYAAQAQAPQGTADVLDVRGADGFALRFLIQSDTHMPVMVSWTLPPTSVVVAVTGQAAPATVAPGAVVVTAPAPPPASAPQEQKDQYAKDVLALRQKAQATPVEHRIYFADYRDVDGVKLPFRLRRAIGTDTTEETTFDRFQINPRIAAQKFAVTK
jgi:hypothetical protein